MNIETSPAVLLVDDEPKILRSTALTLRTSGVENVHSINDSREVMAYLESNTVAVALVDLNMPHVNGVELLSLINKNSPQVNVIILTAANEVDTAVTCMKGGAFDYLVKPVEKTRLISSVNRAIEQHSLCSELSTLRNSLLTRTVTHTEAFDHIVTENEAMHDLCCYVDAVSQSSQPVLITGETGTGKELFARAVHNASGRNGQFVAITVSGLDDNNFSDTLFGHKKGAFTGADAKRDGLIASAQNGTLFLDEIGDLSITSQVKLLRLLQEREYYPLGEDTPKISNARVVVATNVELTQAIEKGQFRQDLYFRLKPHQVHVPALRNRLDDLPLLTDHFIQHAASDLGKAVPTAPIALYQLLNTYRFPGNVRELEGMIFDAVARQKGSTLSLQAFKKAVGFAERSPSPSDACEPSFSFPDTLPTLKTIEDALICEAITRADGNQGVAAGLLGITRQALNKRLIRARTKNTSL